MRVALFSTKSYDRQYLLEANANPNISFGEDFAESAQAAGIDYEKLIMRIVHLGMSYAPEWRVQEMQG